MDEDNDGGMRWWQEVGQYEADDTRNAQPTDTEQEKGNANS